MYPNTQNQDDRLLKPIPLYLSLLAWMRWKWFRKDGSTEVGMWGIASEQNPAYIRDMLIPHQVCNSVETDPTPTGLADMVDDAMDMNVPPSRLLPYWFHTHPGSSSSPSGTDESTLKGMLKDHPFVIMAILASNEDVYARYTQTKPFSFTAPMDVRIVAPVEGNTDDLQKIEAGLNGGWQKEYTEKISVHKATIFTTTGQTDRDKENWFRRYQPREFGTTGSNVQAAATQPLKLEEKAPSVLFPQTDNSANTADLVSQHISSKAVDELNEYYGQFQISMVIVGAGPDYPKKIKDLPIPCTFRDKDNDEMCFDLLTERFYDTHCREYTGVSFPEHKPVQELPVWAYDGDLYYVEPTLTVFSHGPEGSVMWVNSYTGESLDKQVEYDKANGYDWYNDDDDDDDADRVERQVVQRAKIPY